MRTLCLTLAALVLSGTALAADNQLTEQEKKDGWILLFNGKDKTGWKCNNGKDIATDVEDGCLVPYKSGGYIIIYEKKFSDFILACDVKMPEKCNSGIFFRVSNPKDPVQTGFEVQVLTGNGTGMHDFGAIYDLAKLKKNASKGPGVWNHVEITCKGPHISVKVNGEDVCEVNTDDFPEKGKRPDGSKHKFGVIKDFSREGYVGFQDHGAKVWYKNVKLKELK